jgi:hypothetical protein
MLSTLLLVKATLLLNFLVLRLHPKTKNIKLIDEPTT